MGSSAPLAGITVLDLTRAVAGPFCTMCLGDLGARVIKIEEPGTGDETRHWGPPFAGENSTYWLGLNRNKESVTLNLKSEDDRQVLKALACQADVVIENFRPGVTERLGVHYGALAPGNPRLIYVSISGFGQTGPERLTPGYDLIIQAMSGLMPVSAEPGGPPVKAGFPVADVIASLFAGQAILAALYRRERTAHGAYIEVSLIECLLAAMAPLTSAYLMAGKEPQPMGTAQPNIAPYQMFRCRDASIVIGVTNDRIWERFCHALERAEWLTDERYRGNRSRNAHRAILVSAIEETLAARPAAEWLERLARHEVPCAPVLTVAEILNHPHIAARGTVVDAGGLKMVGNPMRFAGFEAEYKAPPALGEHTAQIRRYTEGERSETSEQHHGHRPGANPPPRGSEGD
jgi:crotonobetainyl-CoA:carnitine CoA-transferase CaiB-like acyl-CoA transferase